MQIKIRSNDRVLIVGKTGCGKSVLLKHLIVPQLVNYVMYDYKHEIVLDDAAIFTCLNDFKNTPNQQKIIYRPQIADNDEFNHLCGQVFQRGTNTLLLDETSFHTSPGEIQQNHDLIMRLGRSKGVGIVNCTQRPIGIHNNIISQCEHFFIFELPLEGDRKKLAGFCGPKVLEPLKEKYSFYYYYLGMDEPILCKPLKIK